MRRKAITIVPLATLLGFAACAKNGSQTTAPKSKLYFAGPYPTRTQLCTPVFSQYKIRAARAVKTLRPTMHLHFEYFVRKGAARPDIEVSIIAREVTGVAKDTVCYQYARHSPGCVTPPEFGRGMKKCVTGHWRTKKALRSGRYEFRARHKGAVVASIPFSVVPTPLPERVATADITWVVQHNKAGLLSCYAAARKEHPQLAELNLKAAFSLGKLGKPKHVKVTTQPPSTYMSRCAETEISHWLFPSAKQAVDQKVEFPLTLRPPK